MQKAAVELVAIRSLVFKKLDSSRVEFAFLAFQSC